MLSAPWYADAMALRYARSSPHGLTERVERWPFTAYPISGDMLALMREDTSDKWLQPTTVNESVREAWHRAEARQIHYGHTGPADITVQPRVADEIPYKP